jgi:hypothetical protein
MAPARGADAIFFSGYLLICLAVVIAAKHHILGKMLLLLLVETCVERLGGIRELLSVVRPLDQGICAPAHFIQARRFCPAAGRARHASQSGDPLASY